MKKLEQKTNTKSTQYSTQYNVLRTKINHYQEMRRYINIFTEMLAMAGLIAPFIMAWGLTFRNHTLITDGAIFLMSTVCGSTLISVFTVPIINHYINNLKHSANRLLNDNIPQLKITQKKLRIVDDAEAKRS